MKYELPTKSAGYFPEALSILSSIEDSCVFNESRDLSHPADIFLLTFNDVIECAYRLSKRYNEEVGRRQVLAQADISEIDDIRIDIFNLLFYASNFIEACQSIIKSLFPDDDKGKKNFTKAVREFNENTKDYRAHASKIINEIKHQHRRIRPFSYAWDKHLIIGYFIEGLVGINTIGPEPKVHAKFNSLNTGFSINRDIPYHLVNIYFTAACLASTVRNYARVSSVSPRILDGEHVVRCFREVEKMKLLLLPDEIKKDVPSVIEHKEGKFALELPSKRKAENRHPHIANISVTARLGIRNLSFAPPYAIFTKNG
jgi:hypothetical protein